MGEAGFRLDGLSASRPKLTLEIALTPGGNAAVTGRSAAADSTTTVFV